MKTRITAILLAMLIICCFVSCGKKDNNQTDNTDDTVSTADDTGALTAGYETAGEPVDGGVLKVTATCDDDIYVTVSVSGNPGFAAFSFALEYDNTKIRPVEIVSAEGALVDAANITTNIQQSEEVTVALTRATAFYSGAADVTGDGTLLTMKFAKVGDFDTTEIVLSADDGSFVNETYQDVLFTVENCVLDYAE